MRKLVLGLILAAALGALVYDYAVARPNVEHAYEQITQRYEEVNATPAEMLTNEDIRRLLDKQPARTFTDAGDRVEVFSWVSGFPLRTHDLYVVFRETGQQQVFLRHSKFAYDSAAELLPRAPDEPSIAGEESADGREPFRLAKDQRKPGGEDSAVNGDQASDSPDRASSQSSSEEEIAGVGASFTRFDADGDGVLRGEELEQLPEPSEGLDQNGDGAVSRSEWAQTRGSDGDPGERSPES